MSIDSTKWKNTKIEKGDSPRQLSPHLDSFRLISEKLLRRASRNGLLSGTRMEVVPNIEDEMDKIRNGVS